MACLPACILPYADLARFYTPVTLGRSFLGHDKDRGLWVVLAVLGDAAVGVYFSRCFSIVCRGKQFIGSSPPCFYGKAMDSSDGYHALLPLRGVGWMDGLVGEMGASSCRLRVSLALPLLRMSL